METYICFTGIWTKGGFLSDRRLTGHTSNWRKETGLQRRFTTHQPEHENSWKDNAS